jgi:hypothetical protein
MTGARGADGLCQQVGIGLGAVLGLPLGEQIELLPCLPVAGEPLAVARVGGEPLEKGVLFCGGEAVVLLHEPGGGLAVEAADVVGGAGGRVHGARSCR